MEEKTDYQISMSMNDGILEIVVTGKVTGQHNVSKFQKEINSIRAARGDIILLDVRSLTESSIDSFYHVRRPEHDTGKTAVVDLPDNYYMKSRCEDVAKNTHLALKWFSDIEAAKTWLKKKIEE